MNALAIAISIAVSGIPDAGPDAPYSEVNQVVSAVQPDGGVLGAGWHLTPDRLQKVGEHIVDLENQVRDDPKTPTPGFWIGLALGGVAGAVAAIVIIQAGK